MLFEVAPLQVKRDVSIPPTLRPEAWSWITTVCVCTSNEPLSIRPLTTRSKPGPQRRPGSGLTAVRRRGMSIFFRQRYFLPQRLVAEYARDQRGVHGVPGAVGYVLAQDWPAQQREIPYQVQHLVPNELVRKAQGAIFDPVTSEHNAVLAGSAADQAHVAHGFLVLAGAEGAGGGIANAGLIGKTDDDLFDEDELPIGQAAPADAGDGDEE